MSVNREKLKKTFEAEFARLNEQQQLAVNTIEGPVMVIAGPGTGKTQILASRIGKILLSTDAYPENILCLTYTDAGVVAMRKRLLQFIGPDAYKVNINTFHAFCNDIIQENLFVFEKTVLDPISDLERIALFKELIDTLPKQHPLKRYRGDVYYEVPHLQKLFSTMKREGWSTQWVNDKIDAYLNDLPNRDEYIAKRAVGSFKKGEVRADKIAEEKERLDKFRAAVQEFPRYQTLMAQRRRYDFDDMINWVIEAFEKHPALLARYQEKYQYILVDEYQDTSGTQNRIVELLINFWKTPNVFVVGDDDQSIYRFQGANVENMMQFANQYKDDLLTVVLTRNYRSTQPILDLSKSIIGNNNERLVKQIPGLSKELVASGELPAQASLPLLREYETQRLEMIGLALEVRQLVARQVLPGNIAIIYRENRYGEELMRYLSLLGIPVYSKRKINILEAPLAQKLILLLRYLAAELDTPYGGDEMLFELLHADWFGIPPMAIAKLTVEVAEKKFSENRTSLRRLLAERAAQPQQDLFTVSLPQSLVTASHSLEELIQDVPNMTLQQLFEKMVRRTGILGKVMNSTDKFHQLQLLTGLFDFIREETRRNPKLNLKQLIGLIDLMEKENLSLPLVQVSGSENGVNLLTAHGSKGLEFEYVFFAGCNASIWEKKRKPGGGFAYPDTLFESQPHNSDEEELRRLFYVAITRAERHLAISFSRFKNDGKELEPSRFIAELREQMPLDIEKVFISNEELTTFNALQFTETAAPELEQLEASFVDRLLDKFVMNVTALSNYLRCPLEFYYATLVRIPSPKNEAAEFGSAAHHALEQLFRKMRESGTETFPDKAEFLNYFDVYMNRHRESFTQEQFNRRLEYGHEVLSKYYEEKLNGVNKIVVIEYSLRNIQVDGIPLKGKLDKLEFDGKSVNVVDYKTGDPDKASAKLKPPDEKNPDGGDYWRQAVFYKLLVDNFEQKGWRVESTEFDFIEPDKKKVYKKVKLKITPADLETLKQQIKRVWEKIQNKEFYTGCGKEDCHWCNFVKNYNLAVALHDMSQEPAES